MFYNGVDREDNNKGYIIENCVTACKRCNIAKNNMGLVEFKTWLKRITDFNKMILINE